MAEQVRVTIDEIEAVRSKILKKIEAVLNQPTSNAKYGAETVAILVDAFNTLSPKYNGNIISTYTYNGGTDLVDSITKTINNSKG